MNLKKQIWVVGYMLTLFSVMISCSTKADEYFSLNRDEISDIVVIDHHIETYTTTNLQADERNSVFDSIYDAISSYSIIVEIEDSGACDADNDKIITILQGQEEISLKRLCATNSDGKYTVTMIYNGSGDVCYSDESLFQELEMIMID